MGRNLLHFFPLDALRGFVNAAHRLNISLAAQDLQLTQSAVSRQFQRVAVRAQSAHRHFFITPNMDALQHFAIILGTFFLAGIVKGIIGPGLPTVAVGLLGLVMAPMEAAAILIVPSLVTNVWQLAAGPNLKKSSASFGRC